MTNHDELPMQVASILFAAADADKKNLSKLHDRMLDIIRNRERSAVRECLEQIKENKLKIVGVDDETVDGMMFRDVDEDDEFYWGIFVEAIDDELKKLGEE